MSQLISSAVSGKKVAPKAPPRRRAAPAPASLQPQAQTELQPSPDTSAPAAAAPLSPPATQQLAPPPSPPQVIEHPAVQHVAEEPSQQGAEPEPEPAAVEAEAAPAPASAITPAVEDVPEPLQASQDSVDAELAALLPSNTEEQQSQPDFSAVLAGAAKETARQLRNKRPREEESIAAPAPARKAAKRSSARSSATVQRNVQEEGQAGPSAASTRASTRSQASNQAEEAESRLEEVAVSQPPAAAKPKRKPRRTGPNTIGDAVAETVAATQQHPEPASSVEDGNGTAPPAPRRRRKRTAPRTSTNSEDGEQNAQEASDGRDSDPELHEINPNTVSMFDITHDTRHGKTSEREKKMAEIDWVEVARKRREEAEQIAAGTAPTIDASASQTEPSAEIARPPTEGAEHSPAQPPRVSGIGFRIVNDQIVEDEGTLTIDRHAQALAAAQSSSVPIEEENDLAIRLNRATYINARKRDPTERIPMWKSKSDPWSEEETDRFYSALKMFGTDFFIISKMFAPKTRRQIKLKFVREERLDPRRINRALLGQDTTPIDLNHYAQETGQDVEVFSKYNDTAECMAAIEEEMKEKKAEMEAAVLEARENERQKEAQAVNREKQRVVAEKKKAEKAGQKKGRRGRMVTWGAGTMGGGEED